MFRERHSFLKAFSTLGSQGISQPSSVSKRSRRSRVLEQSPAFAGCPELLVLPGSAPTCPLLPYHGEAEVEVAAPSQQ